MNYGRYALRETFYIDVALTLSTFYKRSALQWLAAVINSSSPWTDKMAAISQTIFSDEFSWLKSFVFLFQFHWRFF